MKFVVAPFFISFLLFSTAALSKSKQRHESDKWTYDMSLNVSRCFKKSDFKVGCDSYRDEGKKFSDLDIVATDGNGHKFEYDYQKMIEGDLCDEHLKRIRKLIKNADQICVTGVSEITDQEVTYAKWQDLETKFGRTEWNDAFTDH